MSFLVLENFAAVRVQPVFVQPAFMAVLHFTYTISILTGADRMGIRQRADTPAFPTVVVIGIEINLAPILRYTVAIGPADITGFYIAFPTRAAVLRIGQGATPPAGTTMINIGHQVNAIIG